MNIHTSTKQHGFTIVELLIVIVVIGVLAAITIVSYTATQNRSKTTSALSSATNTATKAEIYSANSSSSVYPDTPSTLTGAATSQPYQLSGVTFTPSALSTAPANPSVLAFYRCGVRATGNNTAPTTTGQIAKTTGVRINYWSWTDNNGNSHVSAGTTSGTVGTQHVGCVFVAP